MQTRTIRKRGLILALIALLTLGGCASKDRTGGTASVVSPDFFGIGEELARQLTASIQQTGGGQRLLLTTVVDLDRLDNTSRFGRTLTEALSTSLFRKGFGVVEIRKSTELFIKNHGGELILTRDAKLLAKQQQAGAILTGTYSLTPATVILNLKLVDAGSQEVLSVAGLELQRSRAINHLLEAGSGTMHDARLSAYEQ